MATRKEKHQARLDAINALGRGLARRAKSTCELSGQKGVKLVAVEIGPLPEEPEAERCVFVDATLKPMIEGGKITEPDHFRYLQDSVWSETPAVQVCAVRLLRRIADAGSEWARDTLDGLYLDPEIEAWADEAP